MAERKWSTRKKKTLAQCVVQMNVATQSDDKGCTRDCHDILNRPFGNWRNFNHSFVVVVVLNLILFVSKGIFIWVSTVEFTFL